MESCAYRITLRDGRRVSVSDFVYPDWFNPYVPEGTQVDFMKVLRKPFEIAPDGYVIHHTATGVRDIWGRSYPRWRKASKRAPASRTVAATPPRLSYTSTSVAMFASVFSIDERV